MDADSINQLMIVLNNLYILGENFMFMFGAIIGYFAVSMAVRGLAHGK